MSKDLEKEVVEEIYNDNPEYVEPSKDIKIGDLDITLTDEMIQEINDTLNVTFEANESLDVIKSAFEKNTDPIAYDKESYTGFNIVKEFGLKVDNDGNTIYKIVLVKKEEQAEELTEDQTYAINCAIALMSDEQALNCISVFPRWESFIGKSLSTGDRIVYENELWKVRQPIATVLENQAPSIDTAALYERIDVAHEGTLEDPIPYDQTMTVFNGKYYIEDEVIYKCIRDSGQPLYATCASLVGNYFEKAE